MSTASPASASAGYALTCPCANTRGSDSKSHDVIPVLVRSPAAAASRSASLGRSSARRSARSLPLATTSPSSTTRNVSRRCGGSLDRSHASGGIGTPPIRPSSAPSASSRLLGLLGQPPDQLGDELFPQPGHLPGELLAADLVQHGERDVGGDPVARIAGSELVGQR